MHLHFPKRVWTMSESKVTLLTIPNVFFLAEFMAGGTLYESIGKDRSGKLGWYSRCDTNCCSRCLCATFKQGRADFHHGAAGATRMCSWGSCVTPE